MSSTYIAPELFKSPFTCPHCNAIAKQEWDKFNWKAVRSSIKEHCDLRVATCHQCYEHSLWIWDQMYFPDSSIAPHANPDMPEDVKKIYDEAALIYSKSPRGSAALLRLGIQMLCKELGQAGRNINEDIKNLVADGLPPIVQKSLDVVRVTGNDAVHPGQIDADSSEVVLNLFNLINIIVEYTISMPNKVNGLYSSLPAGKLNEISNRDKN